MYLNTTIVTVGTLTYAMKAKKILSRAGIRSKLVKVDSTKTEKGCTHGLEFKSYDLYSVVVALRESGIEYGIYKE